MYQTFLVIFVIIAMALIALIMFQQNKGNDSGGMFSNRSLNDMLGSGGFNDGITRLIVILAILFFVLSLLLGNMNSKQNQKYIQNSVQNSQF
ncbi:preprotein translocase subunit SecG [Candidatus Blochmannia vicinus]|uniref:Protein-export membrane protein SecG n=1 Tax=Candidatus Blochmannia vicinus (nom. nud.) TaxID=251540 RepID=A0A9Q8TZT8_9ENTR|nr:preprotein translocase subunit SecG [Candidatus Blochmannia vicinus]URJ28075.1 preprotein translocase subunit SecG [Candidatus Blochmannia vicinus]URJ30653.1 preprotein translocase subunit SecG [Candidatus Blochmannia vicinus]URJ32797.1 preprotein translocase subunit SecG [Candidatus Blochmannia vicinus]